MKIALLGYGQMGKTIEYMALNEGDDVVLRISSSNPADLTPENLRAADVAIEFSRPELAFSNICMALEAGVPIVSGTTAWLDKLPEARALTLERGGAFLYAANFSVGVNLFFALNQRLAALMATHPEYRPSLREIHHTRKLDAPSGTAIQLANELLPLLPGKTGWAAGDTSVPTQIPIVSERIGQTPGTHEVIYASSIDTIVIRHQAHSREGFAQGALMAARWLCQEKRIGCFTMQDVLQL
jgi:4-hydroxy-tetrahydrodipicolinate reductase